MRLALANGTLYASVASVTSGGVYAFDEATGALKWQDNVTIGSSAPAVANDVVYVEVGSAYLDAFDASTGATLANLGELRRIVLVAIRGARGRLYRGALVNAFHLPGTTP